MYRVLVRAKKDADAVKADLRVFYEGWGIEVSERLGVELHVARVDLGRYVRSVGLPSHDNRWCTRLKIEALYSKVREVAEGRTLIVVGDRDAESELRSKRGPVREHEEFTQAAPLKNWSAAQAQLYILRHRRSSSGTARRVG